jgi:SAM-dependent methyltransferase
VGYLLGGQASEVERLQLQSRVWEPAGRRLLEEIGDGVGRIVVDVGCGAMGWLRVLAEWVGPEGRCTGTDNDPRMVELATAFCADEGLGNVSVEHDDLYDSAMPAQSFDLVHARFQLAPLGRPVEQLAAYRRLVAPGGIVVLEDPDTSSWHCTPEAPRTQELIGLIRSAFLASGGDFDAGRHAHRLLRDAGLQPQVRAEVVALPPGHPYLRLPVQFATSLRGRLEQLLPATKLDRLVEDSAAELDDPDRTGLSFTLVQVWAEVP